MKDGRGRPPGLSRSVKLWPTLVMRQEGREVTRVVRPQRVEEVSQALAALAD